MKYKNRWLGKSMKYKNRLLGKSMKYKNRLLGRSLIRSLLEKFVPVNNNGTSPGFSSEKKKKLLKCLKHLLN